MSLKELTQQHHKQAESQPFVGILFSGRCPHETYATYLYQLYLIYQTLEEIGVQGGVLKGFEDLLRAPQIQEDFDELWKESEPPAGLDSVYAYRAYLDGLRHEPERVCAHCYTRHMGDLMGGQQLKARVPGSGKMFEFNNPGELITKIRGRLKDDMQREVETAYEFATLLFKEMWGVHQEALKKQKDYEELYSKPDS